MNIASLRLLVQWLSTCYLLVHVIADM